jgi:hypothetical protein
MKLKKFCEGVEKFSGSGTVFITDGKDVERFDDCGFNAERNDNRSACDGYLGCCLMLAFDEPKLDFVINGIEKILVELKSRSRRNKILPGPRRADAEQEDAE